MAEQNNGRQEYYRGFARVPVELYKEIKPFLTVKTKRGYTTAQRSWSSIVVEALEIWLGKQEKK